MNSKCLCLFTALSAHEFITVQQLYELCTRIVISASSEVFVSLGLPKPLECELALFSTPPDAKRSEQQAIEKAITPSDPLQKLGQSLAQTHQAPQTLLERVALATTRTDNITGGSKPNESPKSIHSIASAAANAGSTSPSTDSEDKTKSLLDAMTAAVKIATEKSSGDDPYASAADNERLFDDILMGVKKTNPQPSDSAPEQPWIGDLRKKETFVEKYGKTVIYVSNVEQLKYELASAVANKFAPVFQIFSNSNNPFQFSKYEVLNKA